MSEHETEIIANEILAFGGDYEHLPNMRRALAENILTALRSQAEVWLTDDAYNDLLYDLADHSDARAVLDVLEKHGIAIGNAKFSRGATGEQTE